MGPTATGKSNLAIELTEHLPLEIISVDSAMVYRGLDIGTAKPSPERLKKTPHHLIDIRDPAEAYSAGNFRRDVLHTIEILQQREKIPFLVGGTMLYFHVLQQGLANLPPADLTIRKSIQLEGDELGWPMLHQRLKAIDPIAAERIQPNDAQRIQRALEIFTLTGKNLTGWFKDQNTVGTANQNDFSEHRFVNIGLLPADRVHLHKVIAERFEQMLALGLVDEVSHLFNRGDLSEDLPAIRAVGYRQVWDYLAKRTSYSEMREKAVIATRQLAKRQLTWLKSWDDLTSFTSEDRPLLGRMVEFLKIQSGI